MIVTCTNKPYWVRLHCDKEVPSTPCRHTDKSAQQFHSNIAQLMLFAFTKCRRLFSDAKSRGYREKRGTNEGRLYYQSMMIWADVTAKSLSKLGDDDSVN